VLQHFETRTEKVAFTSLLALFVLATVLSLASVALEIGKPAPGFVVWSNLVVPAIGTSDWPGNRAGIPLRSVLLSANGERMPDARALRKLVRQLPVGTPVAYTFRRGGDLVTATVPTTVLRWGDVIPAYGGYVIDGLAFFATALIVFYFKPRLPGARAGLAVGMILGMAMMLALDLFSRFWLERLYFCFESLMPGALLHFALCFPEEKGVARRFPALRRMVYLPFVPLAVLQNWFLRDDPLAQLQVNDWVYTATAGAGIAVFVSLVHSFVAARTPRARQQAKTVLGGVTGAAFVPSLGLLSITLLGLQMPMNLLSPFFILYPLSVAYAIARHDLFSVDRYLRLGVVYAILSVVIVGSYGGVVMAAETWVGAQRRLSSAVVPLYVFAVVVLFDPLRSQIQSLVDRLFYRHAYNYRATVEATSRALASVLDTERIATTLLATLTEVMAIDWAVLLLFETPDSARRALGRPASRAADALRLFPGNDARLMRVTQRIGPLSADDPVSPAAGSAREGIDLRPFRQLGATLAMPLRFRERSIGLVFIGQRLSGAYYTDEDLDLLDTLLNQTALALTNAHAYEVIRHTQADLVRAERMAAVGELASAVAHGIRNPLAGIRATAQVAREDADDTGRLAKDLDNILSEADRLERRIRSILDLARPIELQVASSDVGRVLADFASAIQRRIPEGIRLRLDIAPDLPPAAFDPARLIEVVEVIVVNAIEALAPSGAIEISARLEAGNGAAPQVVLSISDNGPGIPPAVIDRVFDLFYTTKASGTGVGLAMAKRIVERQGGTIEVRNAPTGGAVFVIGLAVAPQATVRNA